jgi:hypothetical protein
MKEPKIDLDLDNNFNATLIVQCGECNRKNKLPMSQASSGKIIKCGCGLEYPLKGDDLRKIQKQLNDLKRTLNNFGK